MTMAVSILFDAWRYKAWLSTSLVFWSHFVQLLDLASCSFTGTFVLLQVQQRIGLCIQMAMSWDQGPWGTPEKVLDSNHPFLVSIILQITFLFFKTFGKLVGTIKEVHVWKTPPTVSFRFSGLHSTAKYCAWHAASNLGIDHNQAAWPEPGFVGLLRFVGCKSPQPFNSYFGVSNLRRGLVRDDWLPGTAICLPMCSWENFCFTATMACSNWPPWCCSLWDSSIWSSYYVELSNLSGCLHKQNG